MLLESVEMTKTLMNELEDFGLLQSIAPAEQDEIESVKTIYRSDGKFGGHKLIHVRVERVHVEEMISHPEGEDFMLIGPNECKKLYLLIAKDKGQAFCERLRHNNLTPEDFYLIDCNFNDYALSFFTMNKGTWHNELTEEGIGILPSFYVGESSDLQEYKVEVGEIIRRG